MSLGSDVQVLHIFLFLIYALVSVIAGIVVHKILCMYMDKEITDFGCLGYSLLVAVACLFIITAGSSILKNLIFIAIALGFFAFVYYLRVKYRNDQLKDFYIKKILTYEEQIEKDPNNWGTKSMMAEVYFKMGRYSKAIELQKEVINMVGEFTGEKQKLKTYEKYLDQEENPKDTCWHCGKKSLKSKGKCDYCGKSLGINKVTFEWIRTEGLLKLRNSIIFLFIITIALFIFDILPFYPRMYVLIIIYLTVVALLIVSYFRKQ